MREIYLESPKALVSIDPDVPGNVEHAIGRMSAWLQLALNAGGCRSFVVSVHVADCEHDSPRGAGSGREYAASAPGAAGAGAAGTVDADSGERLGANGWPVDRIIKPPAPRSR